MGGGRWQKAKGREVGREKRLIYRSRGEGPGEDKRQGEDGWMKQKVCEREKGEERRVKVVIDGRPGLRPLPYSGQGACLCRRLPALPPSIYSCLHLSLQFSHSVLLCCFCCFFYAFHPSMLLFTVCSLHPVGTMTPKQFEVNSSSKNRNAYILLIWFNGLTTHLVKQFLHIQHELYPLKYMTKQHEMTNL